MRLRYEYVNHWGFIEFIAWLYIAPHHMIKYLVTLFALEQMHMHKKFFIVKNLLMNFMKTSE